MEADVRGALADFQPDAVGLTVRNVDTVLMENNQFFLDEIRELVGLFKTAGVPVSAGGAGFSFVPEGVRGLFGSRLRYSRSG